MDQQPIIARFNDDIWPAMAAYNENHSQGGKASQVFTTIMAPGENGDQYLRLREAAQALGRNAEYDQSTQTTHYNDGLSLAHAEVKAARANTAALSVCYTYTHSWYVNIADTQHAPGASEVSVGLVNVDNTWYLHSMTDDHVVRGCRNVNS